jgi:hydrogenase-4 component F
LLHCRCSSAGRRREYLHIDDLNNVFIDLTTFVGFTTNVFSASYIGHELRSAG